PKRVENYNGVTLMVVASKVLERVILERMRGDREVRSRETQAKFRVGRSCGEQIFVQRRVLEERRGWGRRGVAGARVCAGAYDTGDREAPYRVLEGEGMGREMVAVVRAMYSGTVAKVRVGGSQVGLRWGAG